MREFFNSPAVIDKLFLHGIYAIGTVQKKMLEMKEDKKISWSETDF